MTARFLRTRSSLCTVVFALVAAVVGSSAGVASEPPGSNGGIVTPSMVSPLDLGEEYDGEYAEDDDASSAAAMSLSKLAARSRRSSIARASMAAASTSP